MNRFVLSCYAAVGTLALFAAAAAANARDFSGYEYKPLTPAAATSSLASGASHD